MSREEDFVKKTAKMVAKQLIATMIITGKENFIKADIVVNDTKYRLSFKKIK